MSNTHPVDQANFKSEVLESEIPVLVDFWAPWCGPCRMLSPIIDEIADELSGRLKVVKINIDEAEETAGSLQIMSIPTLILFKGGQEAQRIVGAQSKERLLETLTPRL